MADEFRGFAGFEAEPVDLYDFYRFADEAERFVMALKKRLDTRIKGGQWVVGWDQRPGRDYFYGNYEATIRGFSDRCFFGFYHYRKPERFEGSHYQVWIWEHSDEPVISIPLETILEEVQKAWASGHLAAYLSKLADDIDQAVGPGQSAAPSR